MAFSCVFVEHAITDLQNILDYISVNLSNPQAAKLFYEIDEQNKSVAILRIIYSKRNLEELLKSI